MQDDVMVMSGGDIAVDEAASGDVGSRDDRRDDGRNDSVPDTTSLDAAAGNRSFGPSGIEGEAPSSDKTPLRFGILHTHELAIGVPLKNLIEVSTLSRLSPALVPYPGLLGILDLRGQLLPIFDLDWLAGRTGGPSERIAPYAAIIRVGDRQIGIGIDQTECLLHLAADKLQNARTPDKGRADAPPSQDGGADEKSRLLAGSFLHDNGMVSVIDPDALFALPGLPTAKKPPMQNRRAMDVAEAEGGGGRGEQGRMATGGSRSPLLAFVAGGATLGLRAEDIHATVPRCSIQQNALSVGACIGSIVYHGQRIPVLRTPQIAGIGQVRDGIDAEIVVLRCAGDRRIGLAVDTIRRMMHFDPSRLRPPPPAVLGAHRVVAGVLAEGDATEQVFLLDADRLRTLPLVSELAAMSSGPDGTGKSRVTSARKERSDVIPEQIRHLIFDAGTPIAAPVDQVLRVIAPPADVVPSPETGRPGVRGIFSIDGGPVLYVDLAEVLGLKAGDDARSRLLLVGSGPHRIGFAVRSVDGIETSEWRREAHPQGGAIVQLGKGETRQILPAIDLFRLSQPFLA